MISGNGLLAILLFDDIIFFIADIPFPHTLVCKLHIPTVEKSSLQAINHDHLAKTAGRALSAAFSFRSSTLRTLLLAHP